MKRVRFLSVRRMLVMAGVFLLAANQGARAQSPELRNINNQFRTEAGCPVQLVSAKTELEIDPIGTPTACRIYIDYKNTSSKTVSGVKFRIGYIDAEEKIRGSFHAPDGHVLDSGATASAKWRGDKVDPRTAHVLIRVLVARFADGTLWESEKIKGLAPGTGGPGSGAGSDSGGATSPAGEEPAASGSPRSDAGGATQAPGLSGSAPAGPAPERTTPAADATPAAIPSGSDKSGDGY